MIASENESLSGPILLVGEEDSAMAIDWLILAPEESVKGDKESLTQEYELWRLVWLETKTEGEEVGEDRGDHSDPYAGERVGGLGGQW